MYDRCKPDFIAMPELQECSLANCDTGVSLEELREKYGEYVSFPGDRFCEPTSEQGHAEDLRPWYVKDLKNPNWPDDTIALSKRAKWVRDWINKLPKGTELIIVGHGDFNKFLINQ